jgi:hypothetical protein
VLLGGVPTNQRPKNGNKKSSQWCFNNWWNIFYFLQEKLVFWILWDYILNIKQSKISDFYIIFRKVAKKRRRMFRFILFS